MVPRRPTRGLSHVFAFVGTMIWSVALHCFFCGNLVGEQGCSLCGTVRDTRDERRARARCPRCGEHARLAPFGLGEAALEACPRCKGMFVNAVDWDTLLDVFSQEPLPDVLVPDAEGPSIYGPYRSAPSSRDAVQIDLAADVRCPTCGDAMERLEFGVMTRVIIDVCAKHGVWLDAGELERIIESVHPHPAPEPVAPKPIVFTPLEPIPLPNVDDIVPPITTKTPSKEPFVARQPVPTMPVPATYTAPREEHVAWTVALGRALGRLMNMIVSRKTP